MVTLTFPAGGTLSLDGTVVHVGMNAKLTYHSVEVIQYVSTLGPYELKVELSPGKFKTLIFWDSYLMQDHQ